MRRIIALIRQLPSHSTVWLAGAIIVIAGGALTAAHPNPANAATLGRAVRIKLPAAIPLKVNKTNWSGNARFGSRGPAWYKDASGVVHLQGALTQIDKAGKGANTLGTLPPAARPSRNVFTIVHTFNGTYADLEVAKNGQLNLIDPRPPAVKDYFFVSLEDISYRPSGRVNAIPIDPQTWGPAGFDSRGPAWYKDRSGIVHLQGALGPAEVPCLSDCFIGRLPKAARPTRALTTIVHTFNGTFGQLVIAPSGDISIIDPQSPLVTDYSFISLEGVTFRPSGFVSVIDLNPANWRAPIFSNLTPCWFTDRSGIVHLQGVADRDLSAAFGSNTIGTLPPAARPSRDVFTIVANAGTYADLEIARNGQINVINPRPPAVNGDIVISLEGISYRR
jgi:hypothetical protein